jgi:hypothetical protein
MELETTTLFLRGVPRRIVREAKSAAAREGATLAAFVTRALDQNLTGTAPSDAGTTLEASARWFEQNRSRLLRRYVNRYIAIMGERVVDDDVSWEALAERVFQRFGVRSVFMPRVEPGERVARLRSPRRARS